MTVEHVTEAFWTVWGVLGTVAVTVGMGAGTGQNPGWECCWAVTVGFTPGMEHCAQTSHTHFVSSAQPVS